MNKMWKVLAFGERFHFLCVGFLGRRGASSRLCSAWGAMLCRQVLSAGVTLIRGLTEGRPGGGETERRLISAPN